MISSHLKLLEKFATFLKIMRQTFWLNDSNLAAICLFLRPYLSWIYNQSINSSKNSRNLNIHLRFFNVFLFSCRRNRAHSLVAPFGASEPIKSKKISHYRMVIPTLAIICLFFQLQPLVWGALVSKFGGNYDEMTHFCWCTIFTIESLHLKNQYQR